MRGRAAESLFLSAVTVGEIERGIERQRIDNPVFAEALGAWLERTIELYADRILPVTTAIARRWGRLSARIGHGGADSDRRDRAGARADGRHPQHPAFCADRRYR